MPAESCGECWLCGVHASHRSRSWRSAYTWAHPQEPFFVETAAVVVMEADNEETWAKDDNALWTEGKKLDYCAHAPLSSGIQVDCDWKAMHMPEQIKVHELIRWSGGSIGHSMQSITETVQLIQFDVLQTLLWIWCCALWEHPPMASSAIQRSMSLPS